MKYLKLFESFNDQKFVWLKIRINSICREWGIKNYTINKDGSIDVSGDVNLSYKGLSELPLKFRNITGDFFCDNNKLTSLEGCPQSVGHFFCSYNQLKTLEGSPQSVDGYFSCSYNQLSSLEGSPRKVGGDFECYNNQLRSLEGSPQSVDGDFSCYNNKLTSLDGCPKSVAGGFWCDNNPCYPIYQEWIDTDRKDELMDMMGDYDFLRDDVINWYLLEAFFVDAGLKIPNRKELEKYYTIED
jgi:hypothetical protein